MRAPATASYGPRTIKREEHAMHDKPMQPHRCFTWSSAYLSCLGSAISKYPRLSIKNLHLVPREANRFDCLKRQDKSHAGRFSPNRAANSIVPGLGLGTYGK